MKKRLFKTLSIAIAFVMIWNIIFSCNLALASNADHDYYVQYSGSTDAS